MPSLEENGGGPTPFEQRLRSLDVGLFEPIGLPGWRDDPVSLLALHAASRDAYGTFAYLEIGSYLGASLQSFVADERCTAIASIDPRPASVPDDRWGMSFYEANTTEHMLTRLESVPGADLSKLRTFETDAASVDPAALADPPRLAFVDGEHTHEAALTDARFCRAAMADDGAIVFHDRSIVATGIADFLAELEADGQRFVAYALPSELFVVELGEPRLVRHEAVRRCLTPWGARLWSAANNGRKARRLGIVLRTEARGRRAAPGWLKRLVSAAGLRGGSGRTAGFVRGPSGHVAGERASADSFPAC